MQRESAGTGLRNSQQKPRLLLANRLCGFARSLKAPPSVTCACAHSQPDQGAASRPSRATHASRPTRPGQTFSQSTLRSGLLGALLAVSGLAQQGLALAQSAGYLSGREIDFRTVLGPPPPADTRWDRADEQLVQAYQNVDETRWKMAELDQQQLYPRFADAFGRPIDKETSPALVALLDRSLLDVDATAAAAKDYFHRPRPPQRMQLTRVCGKVNAPEPEEHPMHGASYPSGHSTHGWTVAMILARVAPECAEALMKRAQEYEESRLICGMHFPTDVEAGQVVATAVVAHLDASKAFQSDLTRARREYVSGAGRPISQSATPP